MSDRNFPASSSDSSKPFLVSNTSVGPQGLPALYVILQSPVIPIPVDNAGANPNYSNKSEAYIMKAGTFQSGWTIAYVSGNACVGDVDNGVSPPTVQIISHVAPTGYAIFSATKSGEVTQTFRLYFSEQQEGADGPTGATGATGAAGGTGATGAAGSDGTGLVTIHKTISVAAADTVTKSDFGDGLLQLDYGSAHGLVLGDWVRVVQTGSVYDDNRPVIDVIDADNIKLDIAYDATAGTVVAYDMKNFQDLAEANPQCVAFNDIIPHGAKVLEFQILCSDDDSGAIVSPIAIRIGTTYTGDLAAVVGDWLNGDYVYEEGVVIARDKRSTIPMNIANAYNIYIEALAGPATWNSYLINYELELFISYIAYPITWTP